MRVGESTLDFIGR